MQHNKLTTELTRLVEKHQSLDDKADALNARRYLTPPEQLLLKNLKIERLIARQAVDRFRVTHNIRREDKEA